MFLEYIQKTHNRATKAVKADKSIELHKFSYKDTPPKMIAVDGSNRWIWFNPDINARIAIIRAAAVVYEYDPRSETKIKLLEQYFEDVPVLIAPKNLNLLNYDPEIKSLHQEIVKSLGRRPTAIAVVSQVRGLEELKLAEKLANKYTNSLIVMDGALTIVQVKEFENTARNLEKACRKNNNTLVGVSKRNTTRSWDSELTDEALVRFLTENSNHMIYTEIKEIPKRSQIYPPLGKSFLVKLHEKPVKLFRIDVRLEPNQDVELIFSHLAHYSKVDSVPGYPFPLVDAHNIAVLLRRIPDLYNDQLVEAGIAIGLSEDEIINHLILHEKLEIDPFHRHLDEITK